MSNPIFDSLRFMRKYILQLLWFSVPLFSISTIFQILVHFAELAGLSNAKNLLKLSGVINLVVIPFLSGGLLILIANLSHGKSITTKEIIQKVSSFWLYYVLLMIAMVFMIGAGLMFYLIPGIWLLFKLLFAQPIVVFEGKAPADALVESFKRTSVSMSKIVFAFLPAMIFIVVIYVSMFFMVGFRIEELKLKVPKEIPISLQVLTYLVSLLILLFSAILQFRLYHIYGQPTEAGSNSFK